MNESQKQQIYKNWLDKGRPWFNIDSSKDPTYAERQIILEMLNRENNRIKARPKNQVKKFDNLIRNH